MHRPNRLVAAITASTMLASTFLAQPTLAQRVEVGAASVVVGDVEFSNEQQRRPRQLERRDRIAWGDFIASASNSQAQLLLLDRSTFGIGERTRLRVDEYVYDPDEGRSVVVSVLRGAVRFFSGNNDANNRAEVNAPAARIGIRGTAIDILAGEEAEKVGEDEPFIDNLGNVNSDEDEATLVVLRGPGAQTAGGLTLGLAEVTSGGVTVVLDEPGLAAYVPRAGVPPIGPFRISDAGLVEIQNELAPRVARANNSGGGLLDALIPIAVGAVVVGAILATSGGDDGPSPGPFLGGGGGDTADNPNDPCDQYAGLPAEYEHCRNGYDIADEGNGNPGNSAERPPVTSTVPPPTEDRPTAEEPPPPTS